MMKKIYKQLMAKTDPSESGMWLPLWMHLRDTAGVMKKLVHRWISPSVIRAANMEFEEFEKTAVFLAAVHDIGKATSYFQSVITFGNPEKKNDLINTGFVLCGKNISGTGKTPHSYAGQWILQSDTTNFGVKSSLADVVGAHHGKPIHGPAINTEPDLLKTYEKNFYGCERDSAVRDRWQRAWSEIIQSACLLAGIDSVGELPELNEEAQVLLSGLLVTADWLASNIGYFPLIPNEEYGDDSLYPGRVEAGYAKVSFPEGWRSETLKMDDEDFIERFGFAPNAVQRVVMDAAAKSDQPGIFVLEAQMGVGKTEAALAAAEILAAKEEAGGVFFGLPTQATSNGMFPRLYEWAESVSEDTASAIRLAHGAADLNDEYEELLEKGKAFVNDIDDGEEDVGGLSVHPWFQGNKKALLSNFVIGTVDQFLMASLRRKHFMLRHLGLAGKVVIIDECHAYDAYMNEYLDRSIEWMAAYGIPVILLSATLPQQRRQDLVTAYVCQYAKSHCGKKMKRKQLCTNMTTDSDAYPLLTWTQGDNIYQEKIDQDTRNRKVKLDYLDSVEGLILELDQALADGGCAAIILNTVKFAQKVYQFVKAALKGAEILLYHAQFTLPDRARKEQEILTRMGKKSTPADRRRFVLIGTQVLEQSLDYDADIMITQLCPADLLLQRMGRLHRHERSRPECLQTPRCILLTGGVSQETDGALELYDGGTQAVYGDYLLLRTWELLKEKSTLTLPADISCLVQQVYSENCESDDSRIQEAKENFLKTQDAKKTKANGYKLKKPSKTIEDILDNLDKTPESAAECRVRDGATSLEVFVMREDLEGYIHFLDDSYGEQRLDPAYPPEDRFAKLIARQRLRLPGLFSQEWLINQVINELEDKNREKLAAWQRSPWIKGELILLLDSHGCAELCEYQLSYTVEEGLCYSKKEGSHAG